MKGADCADANASDPCDYWNFKKFGSARQRKRVW